MTESDKHPAKFTHDSLGIQASVRFRFPEESDSILKLFDWDLIAAFLSFLENKNEEGGFFSKRDTEEILDRHVLESIYHIYSIREELGSLNNWKVGDAGTGPGIPGFFFRCLIPSERPKVILLDSQKRKLSLTDDFIQTNRINGVKCVYVRAEEGRGDWDLAVSRGFIPFPWSAEVLCRWVKQGGIYVPFIGKDEFDINLIKAVLEPTGFRLLKTLSLPSLEFLGMRHIKFLKKVLSPRQGIPRAWKVLAKESKLEHGKDRIDQ
ncbi:rRNA small subunit methyltransferase G [Leptospira broomii serovar Hurstbridge str. 5399]|uniref:Ribosomal RNA small subunit methyltransferase G n=1 Tax=Leptospira broomii serovar Hurstbridge str. 5399 TaxID=1049789 RepID=T0F396_9LEPT|nr:RsmG family class I SAM-dependent methyltransferase [Leptospira broomii]EQA45555.1 rRNA small subunit methyltransferase G [Leptospira broomii serovar Hurstbridge str. 5399]